MSLFGVTPMVFSWRKGNEDRWNPLSRPEYRQQSQRQGAQQPPPFPASRHSAPHEGLRQHRHYLAAASSQQVYSLSQDEISISVPTLRALANVVITDTVNWGSSASGPQVAVPRGALTYAPKPWAAVATSHLFELFFSCIRDALNDHGPSPSDLKTSRFIARKWWIIICGTWVESDAHVKVKCSLKQSLFTIYILTLVVRIIAEHV